MNVVPSRQGALDLKPSTQSLCSDQNQPICSQAVGVKCIPDVHAPAQRATCVCAAGFAPPFTLSRVQAALAPISTALVNIEPQEDLQAHFSLERSTSELASLLTGSCEQELVANSVQFEAHVQRLQLQKGGLDCGTLPVQRARPGENCELLSTNVNVVMSFSGRGALASPSSVHARCCAACVYLCQPTNFCDLFIWPDVHNQTRWHVRPRHGATMAALQLCYVSDPGNIPENSYCEISADGSMRIHDGPSGEVALLLDVTQPSGRVAPMDDWTQTAQRVAIPLTANARSLRETGQDRYVAKLDVVADYDSSKVFPVDVQISVGALAVARTAKFVLPPPPPPSMARQLMAASTIGPYPITVGGLERSTFRFQARDQDDLPIASGIFLGAPRVDNFRAVLNAEYMPGIRWNSSALGNQERFNLPAPIVKFVPSAANGIYEVSVLINRVGVHRVQLYGPKDNVSDEDEWIRSQGGELDALDPFPWSVEYIASCATGQEAVAATYPPGSLTCGCKPGWEPADDVSSGFCQPCATGTVKGTIGDAECKSCAAETGDPDRTMTPQGDESTNMHACGCRAGFYLSATAFTSRHLVSVCPDWTDAGAWRAVIADTNQSAFYTGLNLECGCAPLCTSSKQWQCLESKCRQSIIRDLEVARKSMRPPSEESCQPCQDGLQFCPQPFERIETIRPTPGFWRKTELSSVFMACPQPENCNSSLNNGSKVFMSPSDAWCSPGSTGILCMICRENHYKTKEGSCLECGSSVGRFVTYVLPFIVAFVVLAIVFSMCISWWVYQHWTDDKLRRTFDEIDSDNTGELNFEELVKAMMKMKGERGVRFLSGRAMVANIKNRLHVQKQHTGQQDVESSIEPAPAPSAATEDQHRQAEEEALRTRLWKELRESPAFRHATQKEDILITFKQFEDICRGSSNMKKRGSRASRRSRNLLSTLSQKQPTISNRQSSCPKLTGAVNTFVKQAIKFRAWFVKRKRLLAGVLDKGSVIIPKLKSTRESSKACHLPCSRHVKRLFSSLVFARSQSSLRCIR